MSPRFAFRTLRNLLINLQSFSAYQLLRLPLDGLPFPPPGPMKSMRATSSSERISADFLGPYPSPSMPSAEAAETHAGNENQMSRRAQRRGAESEGRATYFSSLSPTERRLSS